MPNVTVTFDPLLWSTLSIAAGVILMLTGGEFWRGFSLQALVWGLIHHRRQP